MYYCERCKDELRPIYSKHNRDKRTIGYWYCQTCGFEIQHTMTKSELNDFLADFMIEYDGDIYFKNNILFDLIMKLFKKGFEISDVEQMNDLIDRISTGIF